MRALIVVALALCAAGCGAALPPVPPGFVAVSGEHYSFARPRGWTPIRVDAAPGEDAVAFNGSRGVQAGLGLAEDYPNSLEDAVALAKGESRIVYPAFRITHEGPMRLDGARAYRIDSDHQSFAEHPSAIRTVDLYIQTDDGVQMNFFVRAPARDWDNALVERLIGSLRAR